MNPRLRFELTIFPRRGEPILDLGTREDLHEALFVDGVPKQFMGRRFRSDNEVSVVAVPERGRLLKFGTSGLDDAICVDPVTGEIVQVIRAQGAKPIFVNSSIGQFTALVRAIMARYPYYSADATDAEIDAAARDVAGLVGEIDPPALIPDRYWSSFVEDIAIGDLSTEDLEAVSD